MSIAAGYTVVYTVQGEISAYMVKLYLETHGIPSMLVSETYFNLYLGIHAPVSVVVPSGYISQARKVLENKNDFDMITTVPKKAMWPYTLLWILWGLIM